MATILIVDDIFTHRLALSLHFKKRGHRVMLASSGEEAMNIIENDNIDLVLLDIEMPGKSGVEILNEILINKRKPKYIIALSAHHPDELKNYPFDLIFNKPLKEEQIIQIENLLNN